MKRSVLPAAVAAVIGVSTVIGGTALRTEASSVSGLKGQQQEIQNKRSDVQSSLNDANSKIDTIHGQQTDVKTEMKRLDFAISDTNDKIQEKNAKVADTKAQISKLQGEVKTIQDRIQKRNELLKMRVRSYQETGGVVDYLDVLMGASSFSDFIDRANAVATIMQADQDILKEHEADKKELESKQAKVEKDLTNLQSLVTELQKMNQQLNSQRAQKNQLLASLQQQEKSIQEDALELAEQEQILANQEAAVKKAIQIEQEKQAAAARAAEQAAQQAAQQAGSGSSGSSGSQTPPPPVSSGAWTRPAQGIITSGFGTRPEFRVGEFHYGIDIANRGSNVPIVAAADGVVVRAKYSNSYGNYVIITHSINGQIYTTVYAHQQKLLVHDGEVVSKGQQIGVMGSTGDSTGQHLHFEVHKGEWVKNTVNAIDPRSVIPF
jgi:peptidoglycan hydrolase CwlO-like protein